VPGVAAAAQKRGVRNRVRRFARRHRGRRREPRFRRRSGGTLFLDEVANIAPAQQGKLLRVLETGGGVRVRWARNANVVEVVFEDEGPGLTSTANLFVPFFTTKPGGSGIGLVLSRQIAEAHGGSLSLQNRPAGRGCEARLRLPV
jgi:nitrogen-specific signal transduction histidine kinase